MYRMSDYDPPLYRMTGRTTRIVDYYVQQLFEHPKEWIDIHDHFETKAADQNVLTRLVARMQNEHGIQLIVDVRELRVKMPESIVAMLYQRDIQRRKEHEQWRNCLRI